ncbi:unnamed protein product, partial [marine sediment metagenome]
QWEINRWIDHYKEILPKMMKQDFPGKISITRLYKVRIEEITKRIDLNQKIKLSNEKKRFRVGKEIKKLEAISLDDFKLALENPGPPDETIESYLIGAFAEWETVPGWFIEGVGKGDVND